MQGGVHSASWTSAGRRAPSASTSLGELVTAEQHPPLTGEPAASQAPETLFPLSSQHKPHSLTWFCTTLAFLMPRFVLQTPPSADPPPLCKRPVFHQSTVEIQELLWGGKDGKRGKSLRSLLPPSPASSPVPCRETQLLFRLCLSSA